jgi:hypothetical protein
MLLAHRLSRWAFLLHYTSDGEKRAIRGRKARVWGIVGMGMNLNLSRMNFLFLWMLKINGLGFVK